jgi:hypothetical protein
VPCYDAGHNKIINFGDNKMNYKSICFECKNQKNSDKCAEVISRDDNGNIITCRNFITVKYANQKRHERLIKSLHDMYVAKNADYGDSFSKIYDEYGLISSCIRLSDKLNRVKSLISNDNNVRDENIKDTLMDMANYCIMTVIELEQKEEEKRQK